MPSELRQQFEAKWAIVRALGTMAYPLWYAGLLWTGRARQLEHALAALLLLVYGVQLAGQNYSTYRTVTERGANAE